MKHSVNHKIGYTDKWLCPLCLPNEIRGIGYDAQRLHMKDKHGAKPGWGSKGRHHKPPPYIKHVGY